MGIKRTKNQGKLHPLEAEKNSERWLIKHRGISFAESIAEPIKAVNKLSQQKGKIMRQRSPGDQLPSRLVDRHRPYSGRACCLSLGAQEES